MEQELAITIVRGIGEGSVYALVAMSFNVIYNASGVLNFAQGDFVVLGGLFAFLYLNPDASVLSWLVLAAGVAAAIAIGLAIQGWIVLLPLRSSVEQHSWLVTTLACAVIIESLILIFQGPDPIIVQNPFGTFSFLGVRHPVTYLIMVALAIVTFLALRWFHLKTMLGLTMHALRQDLDAARAAGASVKRLQLVAFGISGLIVGVTGFMGSPILGISHTTGINFALNGFVAAVIGGLGNNLGALIAGPTVGVLGVLSIFTFGGDYEKTVSFALLIAVLLIKPEGVFGRPAARRV